jgi:hypothetical protein
MSTIRASSVGTALCLLGSLASPLAAQESGEDEVERRNAVEVFVGAVTETAESSTGFGIGLEYNRRLSSSWRIGVELIEISTTDVSRGWLVVVPAYFNPVGGLGLKAGPGIEGSKETSEEEGESETKVEFAMRFGAGWEFELGSRFTVTPEINLDVVGGDDITWVYGLSFGWGF